MCPDEFFRCESRMRKCLPNKKHCDGKYVVISFVWDVRVCVKFDRKVIKWILWCLG